MGPLIDTREMYLRTVWELEEEGIPPLRARLAERLHVSQPSVTDAVGRLRSEGLLTDGPDRTLALTATGRELATSVMRKHRLAELLLTDVIGLDWTEVHLEACRWEHVISDAVERRLVELLGSPTTCPHGNPIPGLAGETDGPAGLVDVAAAARAGGNFGGTVVVRRISEELQLHPDRLGVVDELGMRPGSTVRLGERDGRAVVMSGGGTAQVPPDVAAHVYVTLPAAS